MSKYFLLSFLLFLSVHLNVQSAHAETNLKSPNVSGNALFLYRNSNFDKNTLTTTRNGIDLREAELAFYSDVDPYSRLQMILSVHPEYTVDTSTTPSKLKQEWKVEPEEVFVESNHIPYLTMKAGKFKAAFGKANQIHTHAQPFIDQPLANNLLLGGDDGLNDPGISVAGLLPLPWFSELTAQYLRGQGDNVEFNSATPNDGVTLGRFKNLLDLTDSTTVELGQSMAKGRNVFNAFTTLYGADLTVKWRPVDGGKYHSFIFGSELIQRKLQQPIYTAEKGVSWNLWTQYQLAERWITGIRYDHFKIRNFNSTADTNITLASDRIRKYTGSVTFNASEFSNLQFEYSHSRYPMQPTSGLQNESKYLIQANFTIGAHPAHSY